MIFHSPPIYAVQAKGVAAAPQEAPAPLKRELKNKQVHRFKVHLSVDSDGNPNTVDYDFAATTEIEPNSGNQADINLKFSGYVLHAAERTIKKKLIGAGKLSVGPYGLPGSLMDSMSDTHFWYPLLCVYLPDEVKDGKFTIEQPLGTRIEMHGTGTVTDSTYEALGTLDQGSDIRAKYKISWTVDRKGWPRKAEGEITDQTGTIQFTLREN